MLQQVFCIRRPNLAMRQPSCASERPFVMPPDSSAPASSSTSRFSDASSVAMAATLDCQAFLLVTASFARLSLTFTPAAYVCAWTTFGSELRDGMLTTSA